MHLLSLFIFQANWLQLCSLILWIMDVAKAEVVALANTQSMTMDPIDCDSLTPQWHPTQTDSCECILPIKRPLGKSEIRFEIEAQIALVVRIPYYFDLQPRQTQFSLIHSRSRNSVTLLLSLILPIISTTRKWTSPATPQAHLTILFREVYKQRLLTIQ
jgi:hypothetical protein